MKKILKILIVIFSIFPFFVNASTYGIENFYVNGTLEENGDLIVEYYFNMNGSYNGIELGIDYINNKLSEFDVNASSYGASKLNNGTGIEILEVLGVSINSDFNFENITGDTFKLTTSANKGDYGLYTLNSSYNGKTLKIFNPSTKKKAFYIKYKINNIAVMHNDVGELYYSIFNNNFKESIEHLEGKIYFKNNKSLKVWAHGPLNGSVQNSNNDYLIFSIDNLQANNELDIRATFDKEVINKSEKHSNVNSLNKIILYEEDLANDANNQRDDLKAEAKVKELENIFDREEESYILSNLTTIKDKYRKAVTSCNSITDASKKKELKNRLNIIKNKIEEFKVKKADKDIEYLKNNTTKSNYDIARKSVEDISDYKTRDAYFKKISPYKEKIDNSENNEMLNKIEDLTKNPSYDYYKKIESEINNLTNKDNKEILLKKLNDTLPVVKKAESKKEFIYRIISYLLLISSGALITNNYKKYLKPHQVSFNEKYYRDIPSDESPEIVSYIMNKKLTNNAVSASMLELIRKKCITYEKISKKNYKITKNNVENLTEEEQNLIEIIFEDEDTITTDELKKKTKKNYSSITSLWNKYRDNIIDEVNDLNLFDKKINPTYKSKNNAIIMVLIVMLPLLLVTPYAIIPLFAVLILVFLITRMKNIKHETKSINIYNLLLIFISVISIILIIKTNNMFHLVNTSKTCFYIVIILSMLFLIYNKSVNRRTQEGELEYRKWLGLKNFLNDFSAKDKEVPDIELWEKYLVYATLFGCAEKVSNVMKLELNNMNLDKDSIINSDNILDYYYMNQMISRTIKTTETKARSLESINKATSSSGNDFGGSSSGSGFGGGFSSSSSGGGGGTSGGRF